MGLMFYNIILMYFVGYNSCFIENFNFCILEYILNIWEVFII